MEKLRIVFMGTPDFATHSLNALMDAGCNVVGVITAPDKPAGRGRKLTPSPVKERAVQLGIKVLQPTNLKDPLFLDTLKELKPDLQVVVAFRMLPESVWSLPPFGSINLHASWLPHYRGAAPINWAIMNGEKETGVSTFFLKQEIDTGNLICQEKVTILPEDTAGDLHDKLMVVGASLVVKTISAIENGTVSEIPQKEIATETELKGAPKIFKDDCRLNWCLPSENLYNKVRGLSPYPTAWTELVCPDGTVEGLKIFFVKLPGTFTLNPGETFSDGKKTIFVGTGNGDVALTDVQLAGKRRMGVEDFLKGYRWQPGTILK